MPNRHVIATALFVYAGCVADTADTVECERADAYEPSKLVIGDHGIDVTVCGEGALRVTEGAEVVQRRQVHVTANEAGELFDDAGPLLGVVDATLDLSPVRVDFTDHPAIVTTRLTANLDHGQAIDPFPFDITDPVLTSDFMISASVEGEGGDRRQVDFFFKKVCEFDPAWEVNIATRTPDAPTDRIRIGGFRLEFEEDGALENHSRLPDHGPWFLDDSTALEFDFGVSTTRGGSGTDGITAYAAPSETSRIEVDVTPPAPVTAIELTHWGEVVAVYANGRAGVQASVLVDLAAMLKLEE